MLIILLIHSDDLTIFIYFIYVYLFALHAKPTTIIYTNSINNTLYYANLIIIQLEAFLIFSFKSSINVYYVNNSLMRSFDEDEIYEEKKK